MLTFCTPSLADIYIIVGLANKIWPQTYTPILGTAQVEYMLNKFYAPEALALQIEQGHIFLLAGDKPGNFVAFASYEYITQSEAKLHKFYVLPELQGRGAGKLFLSHIIANIKAHGSGQLTLNVNRYNQNAIGFYEKMGFMRVGNEDIDIGNGYFMNDYIYSLAPLP